MAAETTQLDQAVRHLPAADYLDEVRFQAEKKILFRQTHLLLAFSCEIPESGSFKLHEETGASILIIRNQEGQVKAFLNACRHRGATLTEAACGKQKIGRAYWRERVGQYV